jgi:hypothetical protein
VVVTVVVVAVLAAAVGAWAGWHALRDRPVVLRQLLGAAVVEAALLVQVVVALVGTLTGHPLAEPATFWGYLVVALLVLPLAGAWALVERTRWSSVVLVVGCLTVLAMEARMIQLWTAAVPA